MDRLGYAAPTTSVPALRFEGGMREVVQETIAEETPVTIAYNGVSYAVMMATPQDLEDFAIGFSLTEGLVESSGAISSVSAVRYSRGVELQVETSAEVADASRGRRLSGRTGCGICGRDDVDAVLRELPSVRRDVRFAPDAISRAMRELADRQPLNALTGAVHAAGFAQADGTLAEVREDVGRHNALDKLVGALRRAGVDASEGFVVMTSRGSFELVQKSAILGVSLLATVSAPTALAVRMATSIGMTLAGFARDGRFTVYTEAGHIAS
ncbi:MAG: formate dehydrogenase accessory sulfurtransferase FdhD [Gemmatimonadaceae bacterium]